MAICTHERRGGSANRHHGIERTHRKRAQSAPQRRRRGRAPPRAAAAGQPGRDPLGPGQVRRRPRRDRARRRGRRGAPLRRADRIRPVDACTQAGTAREPDRQHKRAYSRHARCPEAAARAAGRLGHRLVRRHRRQARRRERAERQRLPRHAGPRLGRGVQPRSRGRHQGGQPAVRHRACPVVGACSGRC